MSALDFKTPLMHASLAGCAAVMVYYFMHHGDEDQSQGMSKA